MSEVIKKFNDLFNTMRSSVLLTQGNLVFISAGQNFRFLFMFLKQLKTVEYQSWKGS